MRWTFPLCQLIFASLTLFDANAQTAAIEGGWHQISSNAGRCDRCTVDVRTADNGFFVSANNGWTATVMAQDTGSTILAVGQGRWKVGHGGSYSGEGFLIRLETGGDRLRMEMRVPDRSGGIRAVKAIFERNRTPR